MQCQVNSAPVGTAQSRASGSAEHRMVAAQLLIRLAPVSCHSASRVLVSSNRSLCGSPSADMAQNDDSAGAVPGKPGAVAVRHAACCSAVCEQTRYWLADGVCACLLSCNCHFLH